MPMPLRILFPLLVLVLVGCTQRDIKDEFVLLDQSFIPVLSLTADNDLEGARRTMPGLKEDWRLFKLHNSGFAHDDAQWKSDVARIDRSLGSADTALAGARPDQAAAALQTVRQILRETRRRNKIDYFPDLLTDFDASVETIISAAGRPPTAKLPAPDDSTIKVISAALARASGLWSGIQSYAFSPGDYHMTTGKVALMKEYLTGEAAALVQLQSAIGKKDRKSVFTVAAAIEPDYDRLYRLFGNFERRD